MEHLSRGVFALAGGMLMLLAAGLVLVGGWQIVASIVIARSGIDNALLDAIGYLVIAIAVFDVAKYLLEEEVIRDREMRHAAEARRSLTKFVSTILIAVLLEALVTTFKVSRDSAALLVYPAILMFAGVALLVGLGVFQRLSASVEREVEASDRRDDAKAKQKAAPSGTNAPP